MPHAADGGVGTWVAVIPVKRLSDAKTRLALPDRQRRALALALALDTVAAVLSTPTVQAVVVVTDDPEVSREVSALGAHVVPDEPAAGIDAALAHGSAVARALFHECHVAAVTADLPALTAHELEQVLVFASGYERCVVADAAGSGTTMLTARAGHSLTPAFGPGSLTRHVASGATAVDTVDARGAHLDVDTTTDLQAVLRAGAGPRTTAVAREVLAAASYSERKTPSTQT